MGRLSWIIQVCPCKTQVKEGGSIERQPKRDNMRMILSTLAGFEDGEKSRKSRNAGSLEKLEKARTEVLP